MEQYRLRGPFDLTDETIDQEVTLKEPGAYVLEESDLGFQVYVGRSDANLNNQLHVHVGSYRIFWYECCSSAQAAFEKECALYHDFEPQDNPIHPRRPAGIRWKCPRCSLLT